MYRLLDCGVNNMTSPDHGQIKLETTPEAREWIRGWGERWSGYMPAGIVALVRDIDTLLAHSVETAVEAEREACAQIADDLAASFNEDAVYLQGTQVWPVGAADDLIRDEVTAKKIAFAIRARPSVPVTDTEPEAK